MVRRSKRYQENAKKIDREVAYELEDALKILTSLKGAKFDETVEIAVSLGIEAKRSDQQVRGAVSLPKGIGKSLRVIAFAEGENAAKAKAAGAVEVGSGDLAQKILDGWLDFDVAIATPDMMKHVGRLGKVLGPQGKMPSPKAGTVTADVATAVAEFAAGKIEFRNDAGGNLHAPVGKKSFSVAALKENVEAFLHHVRGLRPASTKGNFIVKVAISTTMSPGILLNVKN
jgi:large subunit ribosomal protein L1